MQTSDTEFRNSIESNDSLFIEDPQDQLLESNIHSAQNPSSLPSPSKPALVRESWNNPRKNIFKIWTVCYGFIIFGMNDASIGAIVHKLEDHYHINHAIVSLAFLFSFSGYLVSALCAEHAHQTLGRWGVSSLGIACQIVCYVIASTAPRYFLFVFGYAVSGLGNGLLEASWNTWAGSLNNENEVLGMLHSSYGLGGIIAPTVETALLSRGYTWNTFYYLMCVAAIFSLLNSAIFFKDEDAAHYRKSLKDHEELNKGVEADDLELSDYPGTYQQLNTDPENAQNLTAQTSIFTQVLRSHLIWLFAFVLLFYTGTEVTAGGWTTTFMIQVRHGNPDQMGYVTTAFWAGITVGRFVLGFVGGKVKREQFMTTLYMMLSLLSFLFFWFVPNIIFSAISVTLLGVFMGPLFPTIVIVFMQKTPKKMQVFGIGFATAVGGIGAAVLPFLDGLLSTYYGPKVLGPFGFITLTLMIICWLAIVRWF